MAQGQHDDIDLVRLDASDGQRTTEAIGRPIDLPVPTPKPRRPAHEWASSNLGADLVAFQPEMALLPTTLPPSRGWRRTLWSLTGRRVSLVSARERQVAEWTAQLRRPLGRPWTIAFLSMKGGVGKTTTCAGVGHVFAWERGDMVVALDFNPDGGALAHRVGQETQRTISNLLADVDGIERYADVRAYTSQAPSRLQVLASDRDPDTAAALEASAYRRVRDLLGIHYGLILLDCGTGLLADAARAAVEMADQLVIVASASLDAAEVSFRTIDWLERQGHEGKVREAVAIINTLDDDRRVRLPVIESVFKRHCRSVVRVPLDPHLRLGTRIELDALRSQTREAYVELAAALAEGFQG